MGRAGGGAPDAGRMRGLKDPHLWLAIAAGAALRLLRLGAASLWLDEAISARTSSLGLAGILEAARHDLHPPGYYLLLSVWSKAWPVNVAGLPTEWALRSLSVAASLALLPVAYALGSAWAERSGDARRGARWALWLAALSPFAVALAREARPYALLALVLGAQLAAWTRLRRRGGAAGEWILLGLLAALGFYVHYHALLFTMALGLAGLRRQGAAPGFPGRQALTLALACGSLLPWLPALAGQMESGARSWLSFSHSPLVVVRTITSFFRGADAGWLALSLWAAPVALLLVAGGRRGGGPLATCLLGPMIAAYGISILALPVYEARYLAGPAVAGWTLASRGLAAGLPRRPSWRGAAAVLVVAGMVPGLPPAAARGPGAREDWRGLVHAIEGASEPGTPVVFAFEAPVAPFTYYAGGRGIPGVGGLRLAGGEPRPSPELRRLLDGSGDLWYVDYLQEVYDPADRLRAALDEGGFAPAGEPLRAGRLAAQRFVRRVEE